jgi:hypothetical protein
VSVGVAQTELLGVTRIDHGQIGLDLAAQHDGAPGPAPAREAQGGLGPLPALAASLQAAPRMRRSMIFLTPLVRRSLNR